MAQDVSDDVCDSWEDMIENGVLEKKLEEFQLRAPKIDDSSENHSIDPYLYTQMTLEDNSRTPFVPQVKILKRPDAKTVVVNDRSPSRQPVKTLQQREAEYAEARLRIMGSASSEEEQSPSNSNSSPNAVSEERSEAEAINNYNSLERSEAEAVNSFERSKAVPVTRLPRGPDGTTGFAQCR